MEERKQKEIEYYDKKAESWLDKRKAKGSDFENFQPLLLNSFRFAYNFLKHKCKNKRVLDYGCGDGVHSTWLAGLGAVVKAVDLSENSLKIARARAKEEGAANIEFLKMDCEKMDFPDNSFDIIFDGGTFSSLDLNKSLPKLTQVLKPDGFLIGIETLGHNPLTNLKRLLNKITGRRTVWAAEHIFKMEDLKKVKGYFNEIETHFFHLVSWIAFPFLNLPGGKILLKLLEKIDDFLLFIFPFLRRYCFKIVFIFSGPRK